MSFIKHRQCGNCTACCEILEIPTIEKPAHQKCENLCKRGCGIYETRPSECRSFQCIWTEGFAGDSQRPDKSGIMAYGVDTEYGKAILILEIKERAFVKRSGYKEKLLNLAKKKKFVAITRDFNGNSMAFVP